MDLEHSMGAQYNANPPVTIDVPMNAMSPGSLMGHGQLTTIDQSELSSQLGLSLGGSAILPPAAAPSATAAAAAAAAAAAPAVAPATAASPEERMSTTPSPTSSLQEEEAEEFRRQAPAQKATLVLDAGRKPKPAKKQKKKKDPNEPQKPVSAYALFFRDTQAAIKGQNPNATFGEVSKIVASMWDSLGEEQKQVYKRKTEAAKKEYLKALAAYRAIQTLETELDPSPTPPSPASQSVQTSTPAASLTAALAPSPAQETPLTATPTATVSGGISSPTPQPAPAVPTPAPQTSITKIIIPKQMLPSSLAVSQGGVVTVIPATVVTSRGLQLGTGTTQIAMQQPPLQQKVRLNLQQQPPPLQIKILPPPALQIQPVTLQAEEASPERPSPELQGSPEPMEMVTADVVPEVESPTQMAVELVTGSPMAESPRPRCVRSGCENPPVASSDWDNEYCSSECVVKHCRDVFLAWLASRNSSSSGGSSGGSVVFVK
ncbi:TOX high mobility group box family member 4 isoform C [Alligator mississippiensis]|uniref:TOX high mobility group box family member 4 isoform C n=1 Tax=Alligator mississippiensis TaxID=8496 RepID=A0A151P4X7_ALLMI|nr:TOX high mobility group box family member 4 isoform C [Alligator mississippiensis]